MESGDAASLAAAFLNWNLIVSIEFDLEKVAGTIRDFGAVVDEIEDKEFPPPLMKKLRERDNRGKTFASGVRGNCDMRFSYSTYRKYMKSQSQKMKKASYLMFQESEEDREAWRDATISSESSADLAADV